MSRLRLLTPVMRKLIPVSLVLSLILIANSAFAQCSMCALTAENSIVEGKSSIALGLNTGIFYLASFPYIIAMLFLFLWIKRYRKKKELEAFEELSN